LQKQASPMPLFISAAGGSRLMLLHHPYIYSASEFDMPAKRS
jgi:hypothetical protein